jgi:hypothetical protein
VCSNCADKERSRVTTVHVVETSTRSRALIIGSMVKHCRP